ncbi:MAG: class I SAM-dependent methyltransferase, partial [Acidimicrobiales bacterium]
YLTEERGVAHAVGLTLSSDQAASITTSHAVTGRLEDWRDHQASPGSYDAIVSIGAFEHFARLELDGEQRREVYARFFSTCARWLPVGGRLSLQTIGYEDFVPEAGSVSSFFTDEIFPESSLPMLSDIIMSSEPHFRLVAYRSDADQYEQTLRLWQRRLEANREAASTAAGQATYRRYLRFLRVSRAMFDRRVCTLYRLGFERRPRHSSEL